MRKILIYSYLKQDIKKILNYVKKMVKNIC